VTGTEDRSGCDGAIIRLLALAAIDVAERRLPQDRRARLTLAGRDIDLRLSSAPALDGLTLAIRLLDPAAAPGRLDALGLPPEAAATLEAAAARPHGLFALTGPTGSGKTTTLHAVLSGLNAETRKIMAVEDPIEYVLPGVVQIQTRAEIGLD
jgi:Type II secretory pathway, ATPase PulE/Tfp pilus assembly pathway, ATPase PilB